MDPLATVEDIEARLGRNLTPDESIRMDALLADASANVRRVSTQEFTEGTSTITVVPRDGRVRLPQRPVTAINSVQDLNGNGLSYLRVGDEIRFVWPAINSFELEPYRFGTPDEVVIDYDHGDAVVPDVIVAVVCSVVCRALGQSPDKAGVIQESIDGYSYQTGSVAAQGGLGLLPSELEICQSFARPVGPTSMLAAW